MQRNELIWQKTVELSPTLFKVFDMKAYVLTPAVVARIKSQASEMLVHESQRVGLDMDPAKAAQLVDEMAKDGKGARVLADYLITKIATASADATLRAPVVKSAGL
jgi:hypothetical protein